MRTTCIYGVLALSELGGYRGRNRITCPLPNGEPYGRSSDALPSSAIAATETLKSPPDASAGLSPALRPELNQITLSKTGSFRPAEPDHFATIEVWAALAAKDVGAKRDFRPEPILAT
jgi:hypothetical protein